MSHVAWSPDGTRLVATVNIDGVPSDVKGVVIEITNNNSHSIVYQTNIYVCIMLAAFLCSSLV